MQFLLREARPLTVENLVPKVKRELARPCPNQPAGNRGLIGPLPLSCRHALRFTMCQSQRFQPTFSIVTRLEAHRLAVAERPHMRRRGIQFLAGRLSFPV